jgi:hypothetical protein
VLFVTGIVLVLMMGLAWIGGAEAHILAAIPPFEPFLVLHFTGFIKAQEAFLSSPI